MISGEKYVFKYIGHCGSSGSHCQCAFSGLKLADAVFKHFLCRICQTTVDTARFFKCEAVGGLLGVVEYISCGLIYWHCASSARICVVLQSGMELERLKMQFLCFHRSCLNQSFLQSYAQTMNYSNIFVNLV